MPAHPQATPGFQRGARSLVVLVLLVVGPAAGVRAQAQECEGGLAQAQDRYREGAFEKVEAFVTACINAEGATVSDLARAHRLQALAFLRLEDLDASRAEVLKLLGVYADYEPDPVQDPPDYVGLVRFIKEQIQGPAVTTAPALTSPTPDTESPAERVAQRPVVPDPLPPLESHGPPDSLLVMEGPPLRGRAQSLASRVRLEGAFGLNHHAGGGNDSGDRLGAVSGGAGAGLHLGLAYEVRPAIELGLLYEAERYPTPLAPGDTSGSVLPPPPPPPGTGGEPPSTDPLDEGLPSPWLHHTGIFLRATFDQWAVMRGAVKPYALAGVAVAASRLGGTLQAGVGPRVGIGVEGAVGHRMAVFAEAQGTVAIFALTQGPAGGTGFGRLSSVRIGIRFDFGGGRPDQDAGGPMITGGEARGPTAEGSPELSPSEPSPSTPSTPEPSADGGDGSEPFPLPSPRP